MWFGYYYLYLFTGFSVAIKFLHLLIALGLLSLTTYGVTLNKFQSLHRISYWLLALFPFAILTGTLLIYPKHYTFHTPWIVAAYFFSSFILMILIILLFFKEKLKNRVAWQFFYLIILLILMIIAHDAVTKTTFL